MGQVEVQEHLVLQNTGAQLGGQRRVPAVQSGRRYLLFQGAVRPSPLSLTGVQGEERRFSGIHRASPPASEWVSILFRRNRVSSQIVCRRHPSTSRRLKLCQAEHLSISTGDPDAPFVGRKDGAGPPAGGLPGLSTAQTPSPHQHPAGRCWRQARGSAPGSGRGSHGPGGSNQWERAPGKHGRIGGPFPVLGGTLRRPASSRDTVWTSSRAPSRPADHEPTPPSLRDRSGWTPGR